MEWLGWIFSAPLVAWLGKEVWSNVTHTKIMKKQAESEHLYFKKRLIFEQKHEVYREIYKRLKHMVGSMNDFQFFDDRVMKINHDAVNYHILTLEGDDTYVDTANFIDQYNYDESIRLKINLNHYFNLIESKYLEFSNYVSEQNYILTKEENEIVSKIINCRKEIYDYIKQSRSILDDDSDHKVDRVREYFAKPYVEKFEKIDCLTYDFSDTIRAEMFL